MKLVGTIFLFAAAQFLVTETKTLYEVAEPCHPDESDFNSCFTNLVGTIVSMASVGIPEHNIPDMDPYLLPFLATNITFENIVAGQLVLKNVEFKNILKLKVLNAKFDVDNLLVDVDVHHPKINMECKFTTDGKFYNSSMHTEGKFKGQVVDSKSKLRMKLKIVERDGVKYLSIIDLKLKISIPNGLIQSFTTRDPNQQQIADFMRDMFNLNPRTYLDLLNPIYEENTESHLRNVMENNFRKVPAYFRMLNKYL